MKKQLQMRVQEVGLNEETNQHEVTLVAMDSLPHQQPFQPLDGKIVLQVSLEEAKAFARRMFDSVVIAMEFFVEMEG